MRYQTELMRSILTDEKAQEIIDYITPKYGNSYVGLWCIQAIGVVLGRVNTMTEQLRYEVNPVTAELLLDYWEDYYGIPRNASLTSEQRRGRLAAKTLSRAPINPTVLETAISAAIGGIPVEIRENTAKNTFLVIIRNVAESYDPAIATIERMKPAHLIYEMQVCILTRAETKVKTAVAVTHHEKFCVPVLPVRDFPPPATNLKTAIATTFYEQTRLEVRQ